MWIFSSVTNFFKLNPIKMAGEMFQSGRYKRQFILNPPTRTPGSNRMGWSCKMVQSSKELALTIYHGSNCNLFTKITANQVLGGQHRKHWGYSDLTSISSRLFVKHKWRKECTKEKCWFRSTYIVRNLWNLYTLLTSRPVARMFFLMQIVQEYPESWKHSYLCFSKCSEWSRDARIATSTDDLPAWNSQQNIKQS